MNGRRSQAWRVVAGIAIAAAAGILLSGCSEVGFPAVHDMPAPRPEATLTPEQVKQATSDLISERDHLQSVSPATTASIPPPQNTSLQPGATQTAGVAGKP